MSRMRERIMRVSSELRNKYHEGLIKNAIDEFPRIHSARDSASAMKVVGTIGLFGLGTLAAVTAIIASGGTLAAPTAAALAVAAESLAAGSGISGIFAAVGIGREAWNKGKYKHIPDVYAFS